MGKTKLGFIVIILLVAGLLLSGVIKLPSTFSIVSETDSPELLIKNNQIIYKNIKIERGPGNIRAGMDVCSTPTTYNGATVPDYYFPTPSWDYGYPCIASSTSHYPCCHYQCQYGNVVLTPEIRTFGVGSPLPVNYYSPDIGVIPKSGLVESCSEGCMESGNDVYCYTNKYCIANKKVCVDNVLQTCSSDGMTIYKETCDYDCRNEACVQVTSSMIELQGIVKDSYGYKEAISITSRVTVELNPQYNIRVDAKLKKDGVIISSVYGNTDSNGYVILVLPSPSTSGLHTLELSSNVYGVSKVTTKGIQVASMCVPGYSFCDGSLTLKTCSLDGNFYSTQDCSFGCQEGVCIKADYNLLYSIGATYKYSDDLVIQGSFKSQTPIISGISDVRVNGQLFSSTNALLSEKYVYTDSNGNFQMIFKEISTLGNAKVRLTANYIGEDYLVEKGFYVLGEAVNYDVTTYSYVQYNDQPITFMVKMKDGNGRDIYPDKISNINVISSLTEGDILENNWVYLGNGIYKITSNVQGNGNYIGKLEFVYQGEVQRSPVIEIDVETSSLIIDTSLIPTRAEMGIPTIYTIKVLASTGVEMDPDDILIEISYPSGFEVDSLSLNDLDKVSKGVYEFEYTFNQVEKYSFNIYVDKEGLDRKSVV